MSTQQKDEMENNVGIIYADRQGAQLVIVSDGNVIARTSVPTPVRLRKRPGEMTTLQYASLRLKYMHEYYKRVEEATGRFFMNGNEVIVSTLTVCGPAEYHRLLINQGVIPKQLQQRITTIRYTENDLQKDAFGHLIESLATPN